MALIVENGTGMATAESFLSASDIGIYLAKFGDSAAWDVASTAAQEQAAREATRWLEAKFTVRWIGERLTPTQALSWPRGNARDSDGHAVGYDSVPTRVKNATAVLAGKALTDDLLPDIAAGSGPLKSKAVHAGPVGKSVVFATQALPSKLYSLAYALLAPLLMPYGAMERG